MTAGYALSTSSCGNVSVTARLSLWGLTRVQARRGRGPGAQGTHVLLDIQSSVVTGRGGAPVPLSHLALAGPQLRHSVSGFPILDLQLLRRWGLGTETLSLEDL